jgi:hypothetical protein
MVIFLIQSFLIERVKPPRDKRWGVYDDKSTNANDVVGLGCSVGCDQEIHIENLNPKLNGVEEPF